VIHWWHKPGLETDANQDLGLFPSDLKPVLCHPWLIFPSYQRSTYENRLAQHQNKSTSLVKSRLPDGSSSPFEIAVINDGDNAIFFLIVH
jgi:hypothetical protein